MQHPKVREERHDTPAWVVVGVIIIAVLAALAGLASMAVGATAVSQPPPPAVQQPTTPTEPTTVPCSEQMLKVGSSGPCVRILQGRLSTYKVPRGPLDGQFGPLTLEGVVIMQRAFGLKSDGIVGPRTWKVIVRGRQPFWPHKAGLADYTVVNQSRQLLYEVHGSRLYRMIRVSSGRNARTRDGSFSIYRKVPAWDKSPLCDHPEVGCLYKPSYYDGGRAIHGSRVMPLYPASHGCIRIQLWEADGYYRRNPSGTPVFIVGTPPPTPVGATT